MTEFMRFEKPQFYEDPESSIDGAIIKAEVITDITWCGGEIKIYFLGARNYHSVRDPPEIRKYLKEFGFYIDKETKE